VSGENSSPAGDLAMIFNFMKMLDPGSVVRESEFANAARTGSLPDQFQNLVDKALTGEFIGATRTDFLTQAQNLYNAQVELIAPTVKSYRGLATRHRLDVRDVLTEFDINPNLKALSASITQQREALDKLSKTNPDTVLDNLDSILGGQVFARVGRGRHASFESQGGPF